MRRLLTHFLRHQSQTLIETFSFFFFRSKIVELEEELRVVGNNLKSLEVSEEKVSVVCSSWCHAADGQPDQNICQTLSRRHLSFAQFSFYYFYLNRFRATFDVGQPT